MTTDTSKPYPKLVSLRKLLSGLYGYPGDGYITHSFKDDLMKQFQGKMDYKIAYTFQDTTHKIITNFLSFILENVPNSDTALLLLSKKMGPDQAFQSILQGGLLQMIVSGSHPDRYKIFKLLGQNFLIELKFRIFNNVLSFRKYTAFISSNK